MQSVMIIIVMICVRSAERIHIGGSSCRSTGLTTTSSRMLWTRWTRRDNCVNCRLYFLSLRMNNTDTWTRVSCCTHCVLFLQCKQAISVCYA